MMTQLIAFSLIFLGSAHASITQSDLEICSSYLVKNQEAWMTTGAESFAKIVGRELMILRGTSYSEPKLRQVLRLSPQVAPDLTRLELKIGTQLGVVGLSISEVAEPMDKRLGFLRISAPKLISNTQALDYGRPDLEGDSPRSLEQVLRVWSQMTFKLDGRIDGQEIVMMMRTQGLAHYVEIASVSNCPKPLFEDLQTDWIDVAGKRVCLQTIAVLAVARRVGDPRVPHATRTVRGSF